jgi:hypothetical protein
MGFLSGLSQNLLSAGNQQAEPGNYMAQQYDLNFLNEGVPR